MERIYHSTRFELHLSKQDLADLSGMSKDSCIKILRDFQNDGIIAYNRTEMQIIDAGALKRISMVG